MGNLVDRAGSIRSNEFGGEMSKFNVFNKELNGTEIRWMSDDGICSDIEEEYGLQRYIR